MVSDDDLERRALAQGLMVEITVRLEGLAERAASLQRASTSDSRFGEDVLAVKDLIDAHSRLLPLRPTRARSKA